MAFTWTWSVSIHLPSSDPEDQQRPEINVRFFDLGEDKMVTISGAFTFRLPESFRDVPVTRVEEAALDHLRQQLPRLVAALPPART
jgi:hypothetical protein